MKTLLNSAVPVSPLLGRSALAFSLFLSAAVLYAGFAFAQSEADITFPVAELENCASKEACFAYCALPEHFGACRAFAKKYNLDDGDENEDRFDVILQDGGPGGCAAGAADPHEACSRYCDSASNMRACVAYAKTHGLMEAQELAEAEKVLAALDRGVQLPVACSDRGSCREVCEAPPSIEVARQCFAFAEAAGLLPPDVDREQAEIVFRAIEEGRAPFKTPQEFEQCNNPQNDEILQKCIDFAAENGFLSPEEAEVVKKTGGKGPGGCRGEKECRAYCSSHEDECFAFAEQHDILRPEDKVRAEEGMKRFKEEIGRAPAEVQKCLGERLGPDTLRAILAGEQRPTNTLGQQIHECFENHFRGSGAERPGDFEDHESDKTNQYERDDSNSDDREQASFRDRAFERGFPPPAGMSREEMERMMREKEAQYRSQYENEKRVPPADLPRADYRTSEYDERRYEEYKNAVTPEEQKQYELQRRQYEQQSSDQYKTYDQQPQQQYESGPSGGAGYSDYPTPTPEGPRDAPTSDSGSSPESAAPQTRSGLLANVISVVLSLLGQ